MNEGKKERKEKERKEKERKETKCDKKRALNKKYY